MLGLAGGSAGVVGGERVDGVGEGRWWQDADSLVEPDGVDGDSGLGGDLPDLHPLRP